MSGGQRSLETGVVRSTAVLRDVPEQWSYSALEEVEVCSLRYSLGTASYPDLCSGYGYPTLPHPSALFGDVVHDGVEQIVRALVTAGCTTSNSPEAVIVLRRLGGYSAVLTAALEKRAWSFANNPRLSSGRREQIHRQLENRIPEARAEIQAHLRRLTLIPRPSPSAPREKSVLTGGNNRRSLGPGTHPEVSLQADQLRIKGRLDLLTIAADRVDIVDHKTGAEDPRHFDRLRFYGVLWAHDFVSNADRKPLGTMTVAYPTADITIEAPDQSGLDALTASIKARVREADARMRADAPVATTGAHCLQCPVRSLCTVYWTTKIQDPAAIEPGSWFDFDGIVGRRNGAKSWWMLDPSNLEPALLLRTSSTQVQLAEGQRLRLLGIRREHDPEVEAIVAMFATTSEMFVVRSEAAD
jgi:hypothetical protein